LTARIAFVDHVGVLGGGEVALGNLVAALDRRQWEAIAILGGDGPLRQRLEAAGARVEILALPPVLSRIRQGEITLAAQLHPMRLLSGVLYAGRLARHLRAARVDLIHANSLRACLLAGMAGRLSGIPSVWQMHSVVGTSIMAPRGLALIRGLARRWPSHVICNSRRTAQDFDVPPGRLSVIPCGVDSRRFSANGRHPGNHLRIGMIARFASIKGQHVFVEAAALLARRHPDTEFVIAGAPLFGEWSYAAEVRATADRLPNRDRIHFPGFVDDVPALLHTLDILVNPSTLPEGLGQVVIEAMMAGKPVIASAAGGPVDVIEHRRTGLLVPPGDPRALADALEAMVANPGETRAMGERGRQRALERYEIESTARAIEQVYTRVLAA
jgi:glycosyltransferase involved in cell wall biosynthesis